MNFNMPSIPRGVLLDIAFGNTDTMYLAMRFFAFFMIIFLAFPLGNWAKGKTAQICGDDTAYNLGLVTLNPITHLDFLGALMLLIMPIGWSRPIPIQPRNFKNYNRGMVIVSAAKSVTYLITAYLCVLIIKILFYTAGSSETTMYMSMGFYIIFQLLSCFSIIHLLPIPGFDGWTILSRFLPSRIVQDVENKQQIVTIIFFILLFFTDLLSIIIGFLSDMFFVIFDYGTIYIDWILR